MKILTRLALVAWVWDYQSCGSQTQRPKNSSPKNSCLTVGRISIEYYTTRDNYLYLKSFEQSSSLDTTITLWQDILVLIKPRISSARNTIARACKKTLRPMLKAVTYAWAQKQSDTSPIETCNPCLYRLINGKTLRWTLLLEYQSQPTEKVTVMTLY